MRLRFDDFVFDADRRELLRNDQPLQVAGKALQLLQILIENRPKAVAQEELYDQIWPETFVEKIGFGEKHQIRDRLRPLSKTSWAPPFVPQALWQVVTSSRRAG